jgi:hypothetical protein
MCSKNKMLDTFKMVSKVSFSTSPNPLLKNWLHKKIKKIDLKVSFEVIQKEKKIVVASLKRIIELFITFLTFSFSEVLI